MMVRKDGMVRGHWRAKESRDSITIVVKKVRACFEGEKGGRKEGGTVMDGEEKDGGPG